MMWKIVLSKWKEILAALLFSYLIYMGYNIVYNRGYSASNIVCQSEAIKLDNARQAKIEGIQNDAKVALEASLVERDKTAKQLVILKKKFKDVPLTVYVDKVCTPSPNFIDLYNESIQLGNKR